MPIREYPVEHRVIGGFQIGPPCQRPGQTIFNQLDDGLFVRFRRRIIRPGILLWQKGQNRQQKGKRQVMHPFIDYHVKTPGSFA
jgi:hypothetical protein